MVPAAGAAAYCEEDPDVTEALRCIESGAPAVLVSGAAGTGKSRFLRTVRQKYPEIPTAVASSTGVSARAVDALTVHSLFGFTSTLMQRDDRRLPAVISALRAAERLIIDEVSMVRADLLDAVDHALRRAKARDDPSGAYSWS